MAKDFSTMEDSNRSSNPDIHQVIAASRRRFLQGGAALSLASVLAVHEIMYQGRLLSSTYYRPLEILTVVALVYFVLIYPGSYLSARLERRLAARD